jgi:hypothetical protein
MAPHTETHTTDPAADQTAGPARAVLIDIDGTTREITLEAGGAGTFTDSIQSHVGGRFTLVELADDLDMWLCDDGMPDPGDHDELAAAINPVATILAALHGPIPQPYFGPALLAGRHHSSAAGLTDDRLRYVLAATAVARRQDPRHLEGIRHRGATFIADAFR